MTDTATTPESAPASSGTDFRVLALWLSEASRERMAASFDCEIIDDLEAAGTASLVAISTRTPKVRMSKVMKDLTQLDPPVTIAVVCHAGGEQAAIDLMEHGAGCIVAEGNEPSLARLMPPEAVKPGDDTDEEATIAAELLVTTLAQKMDESLSGPTSMRGRDPVTHLLGGSAFELRFAELSQRGTLPRLGLVKLANPISTVHGLDRETIDLLRRRMAALFDAVATLYECELFALDDTDYAFIGRRMSARRADEMGEQLVTIAESFSPLGADPMRMAVGHAGPEVASEPRTLRDLARRAVEGAVAQQGGVVSADDLSRSQANTTELEAALRLARRVDELDPYPDSHSHRVADYAIEIGQELGYEGHDLMRLRLACLLHDVGKIGMTDDAFGDPETLAPEQLEHYRSHPERGERYARLSGGDEVAIAIRHHHERWDGTGFPDALLGEDIPIASRIIAVADAYDRWTTEVRDSDEEPMTVDEVVERFTAESETVFDPTVVRAAIQLFTGGVD